MEYRIPDSRMRTVLSGARLYVWQLAFSPNGLTIAALVSDSSGRREGYVWLGDVKTGKEFAKLRCKWGSVGSLLLFTPDAKSLVSTCKRPGGRIPGPHLMTAEVWDLTTRRVRLSIDFPEWVGGPGAITADSKTLIVGGPSVTLYNLKTGKVIGTLKPAQPNPTSWVALSKDDKWLAAAGGRPSSIWIWDFVNRKLVDTIEATNSSIRGLALSADGKRLAASGSLAVTVWEVAGAAPGAEGWVRQDRRRLSYPLSVAFTADGKTVVAAGHGRGAGFELWTPAAKASRTGPQEERYSAQCLALSPDGKTLAIGGKGRVRLWDLRERNAGE
jgi:WD40 repeat protein